MSTKSKIACLAALAIVIAAPAFAGQRPNLTQYRTFAGAFASSVNPQGRTSIQFSGLRTTT
jgi:hypothetical protein